MLHMDLARQVSANGSPAFISVAATNGSCLSLIFDMRPELNLTRFNILRKG